MNTTRHLVVSGFLPQLSQIPAIFIEKAVEVGGGHSKKHRIDLTILPGSKISAKKQNRSIT